MPPKLSDNLLFINSVSGEEFSIDSNYVNIERMDVDSSSLGQQELTYTLSTNTQFSPEEWVSLTAAPIDTSISELSFITTTNIQKRTHRKRRVNKKWLKRYGYIESHSTIKMDVSECHIYDTQMGYQEMNFELKPKSNGVT